MLCGGKPKQAGAMARHGFPCGEMFGEQNFCLMGELRQHLLTTDNKNWLS